MAEGIACIVIALVCLVIAVIILRDKPPEAIKTYGVIEDSYQKENGGRKYRVRVDINGESVLAYTDTTTPDLKAFHIGETVPVNFFYTKKGRPLAFIEDKRVKSSKIVPLAVFFGLALLFIVLAVLKMSGIA